MWEIPGVHADGLAEADNMRARLYGDVTVEEWPPRVGEPGVEPWSSFEQARALVGAGDLEGARSVWRSVAARDGIESRHVLQAWHFLREAGEAVPVDIAATVLGAVAEVPVGGGLDVLAAYSDGSIRYLNHSGSVAIVEPPLPDDLAEASSKWLAIASRLAVAIGPWQGPLPVVPSGHARVLMLTRSGPRFGQGPYDLLVKDKAASGFLAAAAVVLQLVVGMTDTRKAGPRG